MLQVLSTVSKHSNSMLRNLPMHAVLAMIVGFVLMQMHSGSGH